MSTDVKNMINIALQHHQSGQLTEAENSYLEILNLFPDNVSTLNLLGLLKLQKKQFDDSIFYIGKAVRLNPCAYFYEGLGRAHYGKQDFKKAIECYKKALELDSNYFDAIFNLALTYKMDGQFDNAIEFYKKALAIQPENPDIYYNMASTYENKGDTVSSLEYCKKAYEYKPNDKIINYLLGMNYLKLKNFEEGWKHYELRPSLGYAILTQKIQYKEQMDKSLWAGEPIKDKTLFVYYEAGLGDSFLFARYLPILKELCAKVIFKPQYNLISLFKENNFGVEIVDSKTLPEDVQFDVHIPIMSIPYALHVKSEDYPFPDGYLKANPQRVQEYKEKYFNNDKFKIGIKWQGNAVYDRNRIIPLESFSKLFDLPNIQFYSLQKGEGSEELQNFAQKDKIIDLGETFKDFSDTAAAVENLDLVICNDTSIAHLVGAMGRQCWILLPVASNWRWSFDISYCPWYKSVKLFKQKELNNWDSVFDEVYGKLSNSL